MADSRIFTLGSGVTSSDLAYAIRGFFQVNKGLVSEVIDTQQGIIIQARQTDGWKKFAGMDNSIQVQLIDQGTSVIVNVGSGQWIDKAGAAAIGMFIFAPLAITAIIGARNIKKLPEEIFGFIDYFIVTGGKTAYSTAQAPPNAYNNAYNNPYNNANNSAYGNAYNNANNSANYNAYNNANNNAYNNAAARCANCSADIPDGSKFCPMCGATIPEKSTGAVVCSKCGKALQDSMRFCPECGEAI